jgi:cation diffusion facilitator family transporter
MSGKHNHAQPLVDTTDPQRYAASQRVTWVSVAANLLLTVVQFIIGLLGNSQALVADSIHTLSDLFTDFMVLFALFHSRKAADAEHPYGHERIETVTTLLLGVMLFAVGIGIVWRAGARFLDVEPLLTPDQITLWAALFTMLAKEILFRYLLRTAERYNSDMLRANAWHSRSDAVSSLVVVAGIGGSLVGFTYLDAAAAVVVAIMIIKVAVNLGWPAIQELVDTGLDSETVQRIRRLILSVDGVRALHLLRTRRVGGRALVDVHIIVDEDISVSEGHYISETVRTRLIKEIGSVADALVHIDPEDDTQLAPARDLPARSAVHAQLMACFTDIEAAAHIERITLHYVGGRLRIELLLPLSVLANPGAGAQLAARFRAAATQDPLIESLDVRFH